MRVRTTAAAVILAAASSISMASLAYAQGDEGECASFTSQQEAQSALESNESDENFASLDGDSDGQACEDFAYTGDNGDDNGDGNGDDNGNGNNDDNNNDGGGGGGAPQVPAPPSGGVETGDGSSSDEMLPGLLVLGGLTTLGAGAGAIALRRTARKSN